MFESFRGRKRPPPPSADEDANHANPDGGEPPYSVDSLYSVGRGGTGADSQHFSGQQANPAARRCLDCGEPASNLHGGRCAPCWHKHQQPKPRYFCIDCGADREDGQEGRCPGCTEKRAARFNAEYPE